MSFTPKMKIGFFGTDSFSVLSLRKLVELLVKKPALVSGIEVVTRSPKRFRKQMVEAPIVRAFPQLPVHLADTGPEILSIAEKCRFDLIVAVSYGLLIPSLLIRALKYGGLNVHPSSLPKYSGASPIQYSLLNDDFETGVTVQTLHPTQFDAGQIISQVNGVPIEDTDNYNSLVQKLGSIGGDLLSECIEGQKFANFTPLNSGFKYSYAPRLKTEAKEILWDHFKARHIYKRFCAMGPLFTFLYCDIYSRLQKKNIQSFKRVILDDISYAPCENSLSPGEFMLTKEGKLQVKTLDNNCILVGNVIMETFGRESAQKFMASVHKRTGSPTPKFTTKF